MTDHLPARRLLLVHAHPDDEVTGTGATMAHYAASGAHVTLVTCTLGEEGEIHVPALAQLEAAQADQLGGYRIVELERACAALGVTDHRFLGGAGRYRDSGMMGLPTNDHPRAFWQADVDEAAALLLEIIREVRPQVMITYDENGFYGHPDHIQAHRVAMRAAELAGADGPEKIYWTAMPRSVLARAWRRSASSTTTRSPAWKTSRSCRSATPTTRSRPGSTAPTTTSRRSPRCGRTRPRSPTTRGSTASPATSAASSWASSTSCSPRASGAPARARTAGRATCSAASTWSSRPPADAATR